jgi:hypothetical protein
VVNSSIWRKPVAVSGRRESTLRRPKTGLTELRRTSDFLTMAPSRRRPKVLPCAR